MLKSSKTLFFVVLVLLIFVYTQYYLKFNTSYRIIPAQLDKIDESVLYEKYPIVVADRIVKPEVLLQTLFKYKYITSSIENRKGSINPYLVTHKYTVLYNTMHDIDVNIIAPQYRGEFKTNVDFYRTQTQYVTIKLKKQQIIILPAFWLYHITSPHTVIILNDPFSYFISKIY